MNWDTTPLAATSCETMILACAAYQFPIGRIKGTEHQCKNLMDEKRVNLPPFLPLPGSFLDRRSRVKRNEQPLEQ